MDLPINEKELQTIIWALNSDNEYELRDKLELIQSLMEQGLPYKKVLREQYGMVA